MLRTRGRRAAEVRPGSEKGVNLLRSEYARTHVSLLDHTCSRDGLMIAGKLRVVADARRGTLRAI